MKRMMALAMGMAITTATLTAQAGGGESHRLWLSGAKRERPAGDTRQQQHNGKQRVTSHNHHPKSNPADRVIIATQDSRA